MNDFNVTIALDDAFDCYEMSKRDAAKEPLFCYDIEKGEFKKIKSSLKDNCVPFINSYKICLQIIDGYLNQPEMEEYKISFEKDSKNYKNRIVSFLFFADHIDGGRGFDRYEITMVTKELKKWCRVNKFNFIEPKIYCVNNINGH